METSAQTAIITGAASGLGRAIALRLARDGWTMALVDQNSPAAEETLRLVETAGGQGHVEPMDVTDQQAWSELVQRLRKQWEGLDLLVNNAGVCGSGDVEDFSLADWNWLLGINLHAVITGCHSCLPWLKENPRRGHIINTASLAAYLGAPSMGAYNVAKAGVVALSETIYTEQGPNGVGVTVLCPGFFQSALLSQGRFQREFCRSIAEGYMTNASFTAADVADAAIRAMRRRKLYVIEGRRARWLWRLKRWMPVSFLNLVAGGWRKALAEEALKTA